MSRPIASRIQLAPPVRARLERLARSATSPRRLVDRARILLAAATGESNAEIGRRLGFTEKTVRKWRNRFAARSVRAALDDAPRSGRPERIPVGGAVRVDDDRLRPAAGDQPAGDLDADVAERLPDGDHRLARQPQRDRAHLAG